MSGAAPDILVVVDPRFSGGTAACVISDVEAFSDLGARVGVVTVRSRFFDGAPDQPNARLMALPDLPGVERATGAERARLAFLHHPLAFAHGVHDPRPLAARTSLLVAHHPPFRGDGSLEYNPLLVGRRIRADLGQPVRWAPVSGVIRTQLRSFSPLLRMTSDDWVNTFDAEQWKATRPAFWDGRATVGRHSRPDPLKWPAAPADIAEPLTPGAGWTTRIMGMPTELCETLGPRASGWDIVAFNAEPVRDFLDRLDAFVYFHHDRWIEAFGRTVAEAILMERPCLLDPRLEPTFGTLASYCRPSEARDRLTRLREAAPASRVQAAARRVEALGRWGVDQMSNRLARLSLDEGTRARRGPKSASLPVALRKAIGLSRRQSTLGGA